MRKYCFLLCLLIILAVLTFPVSGFSQSFENRTIKELYIKGNSNVSGAVIRKYIKMTPGRVFRVSDANEDIKRLYETGYFSKIDIDLVEFGADSVVLTYKVEEKPLITKLEIKGNSRIKTKKLLKKIAVAEKQVLNENKVSAGREEIKDYYVSRGYLQVKVEYFIDKDEFSNTAALTYVIEEGRRIRIKKIIILGAEKIKARKVRRIMKTKAHFFFFRPGYLKEAEFKDDLERIKALYYQDGFIDIKVLDVKRQISANNKWLTIYIKIHEGEIYPYCGWDGCDVQVLVYLKLFSLKYATCVERSGARCGEQSRVLQGRVCGGQCGAKSGDQLSVDSRRVGAKSGGRCVWQNVWPGA